VTGTQVSLGAVDREQEFHYLKARRFNATCVIYYQVDICSVK